jgi:hypothetical protein
MNPPNNALNLRTNTGRCNPLALPQDCDPGEVTPPDGVEVVVRYTRPPLTSRACCAGDTTEAPQVRFDLEPID